MYAPNILGYIFSSPTCDMKTLPSRIYLPILTKTRIIVLKAIKRLFTLKDHLWSRTRVTVCKEHPPHPSILIGFFLTHVNNASMISLISYKIARTMSNMSSPACASKVALSDYYLYNYMFCICGATNVEIFAFVFIQLSQYSRDYSVFPVFITKLGISP